MFSFVFFLFSFLFSEMFSFVFFLFSFLFSRVCFLFVFLLENTKKTCCSFCFLARKQKENVFFCFLLCFLFVFFYCCFCFLLFPFCFLFCFLIRVCVFSFVFWVVFSCCFLFVPFCFLFRFCCYLFVFLSCSANCLYWLIVLIRIGSRSTALSFIRSQPRYRSSAVSRVIGSSAVNRVIAHPRSAALSFIRGQRC